MKRFFWLISSNVILAIAASLPSPISQEEKLRDHLDMFRQVLLHGNKHLSSSEEQAMIDSSQPNNDSVPEGEFRILPISPPIDDGSADTNQGVYSQSETFPEPGESEDLVIFPKARETIESYINVSDERNTELGINSPFMESTHSSQNSDEFSDNYPSADGFSGTEDYFDDSRLPSLLANGLKLLLKNISNYSAVFEFPDSTHIEDSETVDSSAPHTETTTTGRLEATIIVPDTQTKTAEDQNDYASNPSKATFLPEGKANLKSVLDMTRQFRPPPVDGPRHKKGSRAKTYVENTSPVDLGEKSPKEVHTPTTEDLSDEQTNHAKEENNTVPKRPQKDGRRKGKPSQQQLSDIRKTYFESLERAESEDLITYFHRIYPELHHLLGKTTSHGEDSMNATLFFNLLQANEELKNPPAMLTGNDISESLGSVDVVAEAPNINLNSSIEITNEQYATEEKHQQSETNAKEKTFNQNTTEPRSSDLNTFRQFPGSHSNSSSQLERSSKTQPKTGFQKLMERFSDSISRFKSDHEIHNPFDHSMISEAPSSTEIYPSIVGAVIFALFLILL